MHTSHGKCYTIQECNKFIKKYCFTPRQCSDNKHIKEKMREAYIYDIFNQMQKSSLHINYRSVRETYIGFLETMLNVSPSIAIESYDNGMNYDV